MIFTLNGAVAPAGVALLAAVPKPLSEPEQAVRTARTPEAIVERTVFMSGSLFLGWANKEAAF
jgi:hypothetical protein